MMQLAYGEKSEELCESHSGSMALLANNTADRSCDRSIDNTSETIILYAEREELLVEQELALFSFIRRVSLATSSLSLSRSRFIFRRDHGHQRSINR